MKNSKYLGKYDFINYYTKQPAFWFFTNAEIQAAINTINNNKYDDYDEEDDSSDFDEEVEFDAYEFYKEQKEELKNIDMNNPQIIEGLLIDKKSREFIKQEFSDISTVIDFESDEYKKYNQEEISILTENEIKNNKSIILFQPVFIHENLITKPDAIVKNDNEIYVIETKCTTTAKRHHLLDLFFQFRLLIKIPYLEDYFFNLNLCLVKYCFANKKEVPLVLTDSVCITASVSSSIKDYIIKSDVKLGKGVCPETGYVEAPINITNICENNFDDFDNRIDLVSNRLGCSVQKIKDRMELDLNMYDFAIKELQKHKDGMASMDVDIKSIKPSPLEKSFWKKSDLFIPLKNHYSKLGYKAFIYSGNITKQTEEVVKQMEPNEDEQKYFKNCKYIDYFINGNQEVIINKKQLGIMLGNLKDKKVYFDFETINTPFRPIDNCLPFMQILTQCSVIIDDNKKPVKDLECNNIVIDPLNITINDFKNIIDALYCGSDYSYVVYNQSFEKSRLKEMKRFINEPEYDRKVDTIVDNLHDLAEYFRVNCKGREPAVIIRELHGYYSIKKVLPFVNKKHPEIFNETGCVDYHSLDTVQNGKICQTETTKRFHNLLNDKEWNELEINLKKYCENDVRAMVAVEYYLKHIYSNN